MVEGSAVAVLPGDAVHLPSSATRPGPGIVFSRDGGREEGALVSKAGLLRRKGEETVWVHNQQKRVSHVVDSRQYLATPPVSRHAVRALKG